MMVRIRRLKSQEITDLQRRMEEVMDRVLSDVWPSGRLSRGWVPRADIFETADALHVRLEVPGVPRDSIDVVVEGPYLSVSGSRREPETGDCTRWHQMEIAHGRFERVIAMPDDVDADAISATYEDGFLIIKAPRGASPSCSVKVERG